MKKCNFWIFIFALIVLNGCVTEPTGMVTMQIPKEINKNPQVYFCPQEDCGKIFENQIRSANSSVHCAVYDINLENVIDSMAKKSKTADVKIVMDSSNYKKQIRGDGIKLDDDKQLMHNKFCVIDENVVITGSFNPTKNDNIYNNNNVIVIYSVTLAKNYEDEFGELWNGNFGKGSSVKNPQLLINDIKIENYFCPEDCKFQSSPSTSTNSGLLKIINLIGKSEKSIEVASFTFTNEHTADALIKAQSRGINVTILVEKKQRNVINSQYERLKNFGMKIKVDTNAHNMHHKFIVVDGKIVITGSPNFTSSGFKKNDENMLIIYDEGMALKYINEFNRIYEEGEMV